MKEDKEIKEPTPEQRKIFDEAASKYNELGKQDTDRYTNEDREQYISLICKECIYVLFEGERTPCPSCELRYEKLRRIHRLLDGEQNWGDFLPKE